MINWVLTNWDKIFAVLGILGTACTGLVAIFGKSKCKFLIWVVKVCDWMSVVNTAENKEKIEKATKNTKKK